MSAPILLSSSRRCAALLVVLLLALLSGGGDASAQPVKGRPKVTDGDTLQFSFRLHGIDAPERAQICSDGAGQCYPCGERAMSFMKGLLSKRTVVCTTSGDMTYGRPVARCRVGEQDVAEAMLRAGWAVPYRKFLTEPAQRSAYITAGDDARKARRGMFAGAWVEPAAWRKGTRLDCRR